MIDSMHLFSLIGVGFVLGSRHAFEPDHLVAVSTLAARPGGWRGALWLGTAWGFGHTMSLGAALLALVALDLRLPRAVSDAAELGVAALLVFLGIATLNDLLREKQAPALEARQNRARQTEARQPGARQPGARQPGARQPGAQHPPRAPRGTRHSFGFGLIHGLAGSGTLLVLIAATAASAAEKLAFFIPFGFGTIVGMLVVSAATFGLAHLAGEGRPDWPRRLQCLAACASIAIGCWLALETSGWMS